MLKANFVWQLPSLRSNAVLNNVAGGWQFSGIASVLSGEPVTVYLSSPYLNDGVSDSSARPDRVGNPQDSKGIKDWINPGAFAVPAQGTFGDSGISPARLPRQTQIDASLLKDFRLHERVHMQFNLSAINALNHTLFNGVDNYFYVGSVTFGHITSATNQRIVQAGLHFNF